MAKTAGFLGGTYSGYEMVQDDDYEWPAGYSHKGHWLTAEDVDKAKRDLQENPYSGSVYERRDFAGTCIYVDLYYETQEMWEKLISNVLSWRQRDGVVDHSLSKTLERDETGTYWLPSDTQPHPAFPHITRRIPRRDPRDPALVSA